MNIKKIQTAKVSFKSRGEPKDYAYQLLTNPDMAKNNMEKNFIKAFNGTYPNWKDNPDWVHRLKQDTVKARIRGKYSISLLELDIPGPLSVICGFAVSAFSAIMLKNHFKGLEKLNKAMKIFYSAMVPFGLLGGISDIKYIATGRNLFEKKKSPYKSPDFS